MERLRLNRQYGAATFGEEWASFQHVQLPLKFLRVDLRFDNINRVLSTLERYASESLEELRLENVEDKPEEWIDHLVGRCKKRKTLKYRLHYTSQSPMMDWPMEDRRTRQ